MWARSHTSGLMMDECARSSSVSLRCATSSRVRRRAAPSAASTALGLASSAAPGAPAAFGAGGSWETVAGMGLLVRGAYVPLTDSTYPKLGQFTRCNVTSSHSPHYGDTGGGGEAA